MAVPINPPAIDFTYIWSLLPIIVAAILVIFVIGPLVGLYLLDFLSPYECMRCGKNVWRWQRYVEIKTREPPMILGDGSSLECTIYRCFHVSCYRDHWADKYPRLTK